MTTTSPYSSLLGEQSENTTEITERTFVLFHSAEEGEIWIEARALVPIDLSDFDLDPVASQFANPVLSYEHDMREEEEARELSHDVDLASDRGE